MLARWQHGFDWDQFASSILTGAYGGVANYAAMRAGANACFAAGTPLRTPWGSVKIEDVRVGDLVLSRDESKPDGVVVAKEVEEVFVREGLITHLHLPNGVVLRTTAEHPFYVAGRGWVPCNQLKVGDLLLCEDGSWVPVEDLFDTGEYETVYNVRVKDYHTYFVGTEDWGFAVWAHNSDGCTGKGPYTEAEADFLARLVAADTNLHKPPAAYTTEQLEAAILRLRRRDAGELQNLTAEDWDMLARLYAASENTGQVNPPEFLALNPYTKLRIETIARKAGYLNPQLVSATSASSLKATIGYILTKANPGKFLWEVRDRKRVALTSTIADEVIHIGETTQFSIPAGKTWAEAVVTRYTKDWLRKYKVSLTPSREPAVKQVLLDWQAEQIQAFIDTNTHRPTLPPVANLNGLR
jgi:hypothetical protein